jgi:hypothetical protein
VAMQEKSKNKNQELNREERKNLRLFKKQAAQFPWLLREGDVWLKGWKSQEPLKNLRILRNLLALLLALSIGLRYELNSAKYLAIGLLVLLGLFFAIPLLKIVLVRENKKFGESYPRRNKLNILELGFLTIFGLIFVCLFSYTYTSNLMTLILPKEMDNPSLADALTNFFYFLSPLLTLFAVMGACHILQALYLLLRYLVNRLMSFN